MPDINETTPNNVDKIVALNEANEAAGLPPVSTDLLKPASVPEETLSPIYPKMSQIVDAAEHGNPIKVSEAVEELEKPSVDGADTMRKLMDITVEGDEVTANEAGDSASWTMGSAADASTAAANAATSAMQAQVSAANAAAVYASNTAATATLSAATITTLKRHVRDLRIGFVVMTVVLVGDLISHFVA